MTIRRLLTLTWVALIASAILTGCGVTPTSGESATRSPGASKSADSGGDAESSTFDVDDLMAAFDSAGLPVRVVDSPSTSDLFGADAGFTSLSVREEAVYVYSFAEEIAAQKAAAGVSLDGSSITVDMGDGTLRTLENYPGGPIHFYRRDAVIAMHMENMAQTDDGELSGRVTEVLRQTMGPQFAGR